MYGKASRQEDVEGHCVGACIPVMCEDCQDIKGHFVRRPYTCAVYLANNIHHKHKDAE